MTTHSILVQTYFTFDTFDETRKTTVVYDEILRNLKMFAINNGFHLFDPTKILTDFEYEIVFKTPFISKYCTMMLF